MKTVISFLVLSSLTFQIGAQGLTNEKPEPCKTADGKDGFKVNGQCVAADNKETQTQTQTKNPPPATTSTFPGCPFQLNIDSLIPPGVEADLKSLADEVQKNAQNKPECKNTGADLANLVNALKGKTDAKTAAPNESMEPPGKPRGGAANGGGEESCKDNPARCDALITNLLTAAQDDNTKQCFTTKSGALSTIIGAAFRIGSMASPVVGQIALGVSAIKGIINLLRGPKKIPAADIQKFFNNQLTEEKLNTLSACYADSLFQDTNCREVYYDCLTGYADEMDSKGFCNAGMKFDTIKSDYQGPENEPVSRGSSSNPCEYYDEVSESAQKKFNVIFPGMTQTEYLNKKQILQHCLEGVARKNDKAAVTLKEKDNAKLTEADFEVETKVMADIYSCTSYWSNMTKTKKKTISEDEMTKIQNGCLKGKKTKGGFGINGYTFLFNKAKDLEKSTSAEFVKDNLLDDVLAQANTYHEKNVKTSNTFTSVSDVKVHADHCSYGAGVNLVERNFKADNKVYFYTEDRNRDNLINKCEGFYACSKKALQSVAQTVKLPENDVDYYNMPVAQSFEEMYILTEQTKKTKGLLGLTNKSKFVTSLEKVCYGMAMNQNVDNDLVATKLKEMEFDGTNCKEPPAQRKRKTGVGTVTQ